MKFLFVLTSHNKLGDTGEKTGFWVEEFASPYYYLVDKGVQITISSPKGGQPPIDPSSDKPENQTEATKRFHNDQELKEKLSQTLKLSKVNEKDYDAVFYPGGHGPLWDLCNNQYSINLIRSFYENNKPTGLVCHAPAALKNVKTTNGEYLVKGKKVTGFTNSEEAAVELTDVVPFLVEDMLKEHGATFSKTQDWHSYSVQDGNLITGQNPASSEEVAEKLYHLLKN
ncbi:type 1 glutamine amidotransferase domain-containing protein [Aquimarina algiphila]|uniref:type 1 glutamine amidotransferase domain-containing protein n=1 Tax=Aquimarina algiphila TaxID=2047982 RepID=UPI00232FC6A7|nr:type 1 glutamine amidotransferase domain-containing protein [Aquimarina algiphila]